MKTGITRVEITDSVNGRGASRFRDSQARWGMADDLYRHIAHRLDMPLKSGSDAVCYSLDEARAALDWEMGIDVILSFENGMEITMQEKFLLTTFRTVTVEYMNDPIRGMEGDWFTLKANWYFVGYDEGKDMRWNRWIMLNWPATKVLTAQGKIPWQERLNGRQGARASFRYAPMNAFPPECVIAYSGYPQYRPYPHMPAPARQQGGLFSELPY